MLFSTVWLDFSSFREIKHDYLKDWEYSKNNAQAEFPEAGFL